MNTGHIRVENGMMVFHKWSANASQIAEEMVVGERWIIVWGLPFTVWSGEVFNGIGRRCGGLLEIDP